MFVPYVNLSIQYQLLKCKIDNRIMDVLESGNYILGNEVFEFERKISDFCNSNYCVGVSNGTSALMLALKSLGIGNGDEVITAPNSLFATATSIALTNAKPVFADVKDDFTLDPKLVKECITDRTRAIIPVHLTGLSADMNALMEISREHEIPIVEDAAQAVGAYFERRHVGTFGVAGCFSLYPLKNLGGVGDGGFILTQEEKTFESLLRLRNLGMITRGIAHEWSINSRLDELQAAILNVKIEKLQSWNKRRRMIAQRYTESLSKHVLTPIIRENRLHVYHTYVIRTSFRDELKKHLHDRNIETAIHYPVPIHLQPAAKNLGYRMGDFPEAETQSKEILSLPIYSGIADEQVEYVIENIIDFFNSL